MSKIELRLSDVDPPDPDPMRTIYRDILNLPSTTYLGLTIRYFNFDDVTLYFQVTGTGPGYTFSTVNLGSLASGTSAYINLDNFASRSRPGSELTETVNLILRAYTDSGYTNLKWTYTRTVTVIWINSGDPSWTVDILNNFDDGTVQTWAVANEVGNAASYPKIAVTSTYALSPPNSLMMTQMRFGNQTHYLKFITVNNGDTVLIFLGIDEASHTPDRLPLDKWMRLIVPLPRNVTVDFRIRVSWVSFAVGNYCRARLYKSITTPDRSQVFAVMDLRNRRIPKDAATTEAFTYMDDFKVISRS